jgi:hypothetical protein
MGMTSAKAQYSYFENLERTIKIALAVYVFFLLAGISLLALAGLPPFAAYATGSLRQGAFLAALFLACYAFLSFRITKISWVGELHIWLDRKFFGFLFRSNEIIFRTLLFTLRPEERDRAYELAPEARERIAETIFSKLAGNTHLFPTLLRSGIFQYWIWYWVTNYGTAIFSLLTVVSFPVILASAAPVTKGLFGAFWTLALVHLLVGLVLGNRLMRMTKEVSQDIVQSYAGEIAAILRAQLAQSNA